MAPAEGGLGQALVGDKIMINSRCVSVTKLLGEGGFSYVYLVKEISDTSAGQSLNSTVHGEQVVTRTGSGSAGGGAGAAVGRSGSFGNGKQQERRSIGGSQPEKKEMVLKVTSILSRQQRDIAEKEAKLLSRLSHPSIIKMHDTCYRSVAHSSTRKKEKERPQHLILMEFCEGGHALDVCNQMVAKGERFDLSTLIIAFGQICNAVSYLHAQRPPIVHRDLKPANFLVKNGAYKLCDFGSAVFGHVDLKTPQARAEAEEVIQKTTTQMFRAPEMVDLYMAKKLTQATDVWALGCCLYSLAFLQNCFEEGSNLAILSRKYKIPEDNPYGEGLVELIDRMLTIDSKARADMTEVILCLSAVYSGRPLPPRKERSSSSSSKSKKEKEQKKKNENAGTFRTNTQGMYGEDLAIDPNELKKQPVQAKKLDPNSAAARRRAAAAAAAPDTSGEFTAFHNRFDTSKVQGDPDTAFSGDTPFAFDSRPSSSKGSTHSCEQDVFASFDTIESGEDVDFENGWGDASGSLGFDAFASFSPDAREPEFTNGSDPPPGEEDGERRGRRHSGRQRKDDEAKRTPRRTHSGSKRGSRSKNDIDEVVAAAGVLSVDDDITGSKPRRTRSSGRQHRSKTSVDEIKEMSRSVGRSNSAGSRRSSSNKEAD